MGASSCCCYQSPQPGTEQVVKAMPLVNEVTAQRSKVNEESEEAVQINDNGFPFGGKSSPKVTSETDLNKTVSSPQSSSPDNVDSASNEAIPSASDAEKPDSFNSGPDSPSVNGASPKTNASDQSIGNSLYVEPSKRTLAPSERSVITFSAEETALIGELQRATDPVRKWIYNNIEAWSKLPVGDQCEGSKFLDVASNISGVYPYVFSMSYACRHLTKDLDEHITASRKHWPEGAVNVRDAVQKELDKKGLKTLEDKYWNTCTVRLMWVMRVMRIMELILDGIVNSDTDPVTCAQKALDTVAGKCLNSALKKIADFIIYLCVFKKRSKLFEKMALPEPEAQKCIKVLIKTLQPHARFYENLFNEMVPTLIAKKP